MYVLDVVPLVKIPLSSPQILSYFSRERTTPGALVRVSLRGRKVNAIVGRVATVKERKLEIKKKDFPLRGAEKILSSGPLIPQLQLDLAFDLYQYYLAPLGLILKLFLPRAFLKRQKPVEKVVSPPSSIVNRKNARPLLLWQEEREKFYLKEIKKALREGKQVLFLLPQIEEINEVSNKLKNELKEIESKVRVWHSELKGSLELETWSKVREGEIKIIVGTRSAAFLPFRNLGLIIVEQEESPFYKSWDRHPKYHAKTVALKLAQTSGAKIILGTSLPSLESYFFTEAKKYDSSNPPPPLPLSKLEIVDLRKERLGGNYSVFSQKLQEEIQQRLLEKKQTILFVNRRGLARALFCRDCGYTIECDHCEAPLVFHQTAKPRESMLGSFLLCHHCGAQKATPRFCPRCQGWAIKFLGIGTQKVVAELEKLFPAGRIGRLDSDIAQTPKEQKKICQDFAQQKYDFLVATQLLWTCSTSEVEQVGLVAVVLLEQMLNLPDFRSTERTFAILKKLQQLAPQLLVQTYHPELSVLQSLSANQVDSFYQEELRNRREFFYPPFAQIIKLSYSHSSPERGQEEAHKVRKILEKQAALNPQTSLIQILGPIPGFIPKLKGKYVWNIILKVKPSFPGIRPPTSDLQLPIFKDWSVDVDPHSLL